MAEKLTPWFAGEVKPKRIGIYQSQGGWPGRAYQFWNGYFWGGWGPNEKTAFDNRNFESERQTPEWRGLSSNPKDTK